MTYKTRASYETYDGLYIHELVAIVGYMERKDPVELGRVIREPPESHFSVKSQGMRDFIADVITCKIKRPKHKKASIEREDFEIYLKVRDLMDMGETRANAEAIVASEVYKSEGAVNDAYDRTLKKIFKKGT